MYKKGIVNTAADGLSRRSHSTHELFSVGTVQASWLQETIQSYENDPKAQELLQVLAINPSGKSSVLVTTRPVEIQGLYFYF